MLTNTILLISIFYVLVEYTKKRVLYELFFIYGDIQKKSSKFRTLFFRDPGGIRTHDPQLRRLLLYPAELRDQHA